MKRHNFYRQYTQEATNAADLIEKLYNETYVEDFHTVTRALYKLGVYRHVSDWDTMSAIAAIYRLGIAVGIRTERKRRKDISA